jgi:transcriptional regulator with XRE-family HTH domain
VDESAIDPVIRDREPPLGWQPRTVSGGELLRALRRSLGLTQLEIELEADLGSGYLQRVESGKVANPSRGTVERILVAMGARFSERREVLVAFGYTVSTPLPDNDEIEWAREECADDLSTAPFPAYVLDCRHRLIAWNDHAAAMLGIVSSDPAFAGLAGRSMIVKWFHPASFISNRVVEPDVFYPALIRALRYEMRRFGGEPWYAEVAAELQAQPLFSRYWRQTSSDLLPNSSGRARIPLRLRVPLAGVLTFRVAAEPFVRDERFRTIDFVPADPPSLRWCAERSG